MPTATITSKGQMTLPKKIRMILRLKRGDKVGFFVGKTGEYVMQPITTDIKELKGLLSKPKKPVSLDDMKKAIRGRKRI